MNLTELNNFYSSWKDQKTVGKLTDSLNIKKRILTTIPKSFLKKFWCAKVFIYSRSHYLLRDRMQKRLAVIPVGTKFKTDFTG